MFMGPSGAIIKKFEFTFLKGTGARAGVVTGEIEDVLWLLERYPLNQSLPLERTEAARNERAVHSSPVLGSGGIFFYCCSCT
ncbi:hypothetical protein JTE90_020571 [Oedothorax gibbosus]|uniref:Uncharacterized protein n=1 Tax=Oedothorax gibbosus TaxID=931172 RepID=A0AAV6VWI6_9ARAC|nr:hypothetical protein JTE90_020571 [Oedothorax gibbosus]